VDKLRPVKRNLSNPQRFRALIIRHFINFYFLKYVVESVLYSKENRNVYGNVSFGVLVHLLL
jgi:hypothetical protein